MAYKNSAVIILAFLLLNPYYGCMIPAPYENREENANILKEINKTQPAEVKTLKNKRSKIRSEYRKLQQELSELNRRIKEHNRKAKKINTRDKVAVDAYNRAAKAFNTKKPILEGKFAEAKKELDTIDERIDDLGKVISPDGRFAKYPSGVVYDTETGLEWVAGPDVDTNWYEAKSWVQRLTVKQGGWRMPTIKELKTLYQWKAGPRNITEFLKTTGWWVWSGQLSGYATAGLFYFRFRDGEWSGINCTTSEGIRAFAVRNRKK